MSDLHHAANSSNHLAVVAGERAQATGSGGRDDAAVQQALERAQIRVVPLGLAALESVGEGPEWSADLTVLPVFSDERPLQGLAGVLDWRLGGRLSGLLREGICTGNEGEHVLTLSRHTPVLWRVVLLGLGGRTGFDSARAQVAGAHVLDLCNNLCVQELMLGMPAHTPTLPVPEAALWWAKAVVRARQDALARGAIAPKKMWILAETEHLTQTQVELATAASVTN